ncbi:hypothetical protein QZH41_012219 [Actinostola sp. cb2023]|nr:hypothetical protein QZH41_012219 [Actinostola sp. cb2023]
MIPSSDGDDIATYLCRQGYELGSKLGEGAYAIVREAYSNRHGSLLKSECDRYNKLQRWTHAEIMRLPAILNVAVKIIDKEKLSDRTLHKFLKREVEALRKVDHKNVICLLEVIESERRFYIIMELAQNGDLLKLLQERGRLPESEAKRVFCKVVKGILHCHKKGIAHRDLKLENILLSRKNEPIISDFGFARSVSSGNTETCQSRARSCTFCGSYAYAAPEILQALCVLTRNIHSVVYISEIAPSTASTHWIAERVFSIALLGLIPAGIFCPCAAVDWGLAICIPIHNHWGIHAILADYVNKGPNIPGRARGIWLVLTVLQFMGLCYFNINDVGICNGIRMIWNI